MMMAMMMAMAMDSWRVQSVGQTAVDCGSEVKSGWSSSAGEFGHRNQSNRWQHV